MCSSDLAEPGRIAASNGHTGTIRQEQARSFEADPARTTGNQRRFATQHHPKTSSGFKMRLPLACSEEYLAKLQDR